MGPLFLNTGECRMEGAHVFQKDGVIHFKILESRISNWKPRPKFINIFLNFLPPTLPNHPNIPKCWEFSLGSSQGPNISNCCKRTDMAQILSNISKFRWQVQPSKVPNFCNPLWRSWISWNVVPVCLNIHQHCAQQLGNTARATSPNYLPIAAWTCVLLNNSQCWPIALANLSGFWTPAAHAVPNYAKQFQVREVFQ